MKKEDLFELFEKIAVKCMEHLPKWYLQEVYGMDFNIELEAEVEFKTQWATSPYWEKEYLDAA